jgi:hypothetical protein
MNPKMMRKRQNFELIFARNQKNTVFEKKRGTAYNQNAWYVFPLK